MTMPFGERPRIPGTIGSAFGHQGGRVPGAVGLETKLSVSSSSSVLSSLPPIVLGALGGMDVQGEQILGTYLYGGGVAHDVDDPDWAEYMMAHKVLKAQIMSQLMPAVKEVADKKTLGRFPVVVRFHAEFPENNDLSGYALLHGSNKSAGDFTITGFAEVSEAIDPKDGDFDIELELRFVFNDIVDPNHYYTMDTIRSKMATIFTLGQAQPYRLAIIWYSKCLAEVRPGAIHFSGYPAANRRTVRPLPRATLDVEGMNKKRAAEKELLIVDQLKRKLAADDVKALADRKNRLLWLFYGIGSYMSGTYLDRLNNGGSDDELAQLMKQRISKELRAECIEALKGKRPTGTEPEWPASGPRTLREVPAGFKVK